MTGYARQGDVKLQEYFSLKSKHWVLLTARVVFAVLTMATIHFVGFFSTLSDNYFVIMTPSLIRRVFWEFVSLLAEASLWIAILLFLIGIVRAFASGLARAFWPNTFEERQAYALDFIQILGLYLAVLAVKYIPSEASALVRLVSVFTIILMLGLLYLVFFHELNGDSKWTRFARELRRPELAFYALIATLLVCAYLSGKGLAWTLMKVEPRTILTTTGEFQATVIDGSELGFLFMTKEGLILMPLHEVRQIKLAEPQ